MIYEAAVEKFLVGNVAILEPLVDCLVLVLVAVLLAAGHFVAGSEKSLLKTLVVIPRR
jgi:hypothetical protein